MRQQERQHGPAREEPESRDTSFVDSPPKIINQEHSSPTQSSGGMRANTETIRSSDGAGASTTMSINPEQKSPLIEWADNINRNHRILFPLI